MMQLCRGILWVALASTAVFSCLLWYVLPSFGAVAELINIVVVVALVVAGMALWSWSETEEALEHAREKWAFKDRVEAEWALNDKIAAVVPGGPLVLEHSLKRLAASCK
jgi:hypothetical protein